MLLQNYHQNGYKVLTMKNEPAITLSEWIRQRRKDDNQTIRGLALKIGIPHTTLADIENGLPASVNVCKAIAAYYGVLQIDILKMNGTIDDELDTKETPDIAATVLVMKNLNPSLQKDVKEYALHKQRLAERNKANGEDTQKSGAD